MLAFPNFAANWIAGLPVAAQSGESFPKFSPHDGAGLCTVARSNIDDVAAAVAAARAAQLGWAATPAVQRGAILHAVCNALEARAGDLAAVVAAETGKSPKDALGECGGAVALGRFYAGEGQRLYGRTTTSGTPNKYAMTVRQPCGVAALIIAANTPIANVAWKVFPALICGNAAVLKAAEDTPTTAHLFAEIAHAAGLPAGVLNVIQGLGQEAGRPLVEHDGIDVLSFTGSTAVGKWIAETAGRRLLKVSLELGGKNPFVVCEDADLDNAVKWAMLSAFSNAGQRCAAGSRLIVVDAVYDRFRDLLVERTKALKVGNTDDCDFGPVINERQMTNMLTVVERARASGATILTGGHRVGNAGCYVAPTLVEGAAADVEISTCELFGPIATLHRVKGYAEALELTNRSDYGLTACIHTRSFDRATHFVHAVHSGVAVVNAGTYGSEPHMPFGGVKQSGNGSREPGTEALDIYTELKDIYLNVDPRGV
ncbi:aldehyde dehydrogenase family protein [Magnetospirillum fulvum]|uniref:Aldehyde dehydrogenase (NAD+) n=1 Tax=Magnetospirillum fulvum TaxID=1082 RepID=A0A1H6H3T5_MAGFU|nr:aldehyde dehydrogenase family protein [Magnetospirillum fulvum]SEH30086.1 aldehyde dehydrogenase (NAD+) [Magnetospirillum fulvum]